MKSLKFLKVDCVIDIGAAPGSWSQYVSKVVKNGKIISIDLKKWKKLKILFKLKVILQKIKFNKKLKINYQSKVDVVMSDMAVNTTGIKNIDSIQTGELCKEAMIFSKEVIKKKGFFISKIFMGSTFNEIVALGKKFLKK